MAAASTANHGFTFRSITRSLGCRRVNGGETAVKKRQTHKNKKQHTQKIFSPGRAEKWCCHGQQQRQREFFFLSSSSPVVRVAVSVDTSGLRGCEKLFSSSSSSSSETNRVNKTLQTVCFCDHFVRLVHHAKLQHAELSAKRSHGPMEKNSFQTHKYTHTVAEAD